MNKKGFVTSALLYGVLSLFLVLILGTVAAIGNRKITNDKIKQSALDDVQNLTTNETCFTKILNERDNYTITEYNPSCPKTVYIPERIGGYLVDEIGADAFAHKNLINVTIKSNITRISMTSFQGNGTSSKPLLYIIKGTIPLEVDESGTSSSTFNGWGAVNYTIRQD